MKTEMEESISRKLNVQTMQYHLATQEASVYKKTILCQLRRLKVLIILDCISKEVQT